MKTIAAISSRLFSAPKQPAWRFRDECGGVTFWIRRNKRSLVRCGRCGRRRWRKNSVVQVYYDGLYYWCADQDMCLKAWEIGRRKEPKP